MTDGGPTAGAPNIVLLVGTGQHSDPWHALPATSKKISDLLLDNGYNHVHVVSTDAPTEVLEALADAGVLIVNASSDLSHEAPDSTTIVDAITSHSRRGGGVLASHSSALAFRDDARWAALLGGRWVPGTTMHPQIGNALIQAVPDTAVELSLGDFTVYDERYTHLETSEQAQVLAFHTEDGMTHPLIWVIDGRPDWGRVAYVALGHGVESYGSIRHQEAFLTLVRWVANTGFGEKS